VDYSPDGQKIVFVSYYNYDAGYASATATAAPGTGQDEADNEICVVNANGAGMTRLTDDANDEYSVVWSPDGTQIAFIRYIWEPDSVRSPIVIMDTDGSNEVELPGTESANWSVPRALDWSPDGESIGFASGDCNIYVTRADGSGTPTKLTSDPAWQCSESPTWSPGGKRIAFQSERDTRSNVFGDPKDIYVMNALGEGGTDLWRQLTEGPTQDAYPAWSPSGTEIAFNKSQPGTGSEAIYKVAADGSKETRLASGSYPTWLADGAHIAYLGSRGIMKMNADGSDQTLVVANAP
jgi:Tol biopolymer transport system component